MYCPSCSALAPALRGQPAPAAPPRRGLGCLRALLCARCGRPLAPVPGPGATERVGLLRRLGLADGAGPLLHPAA